MKKENEKSQNERHFHLIIVRQKDAVTLPTRFPGGAIGLCLNGEADITVGSVSYKLHRAYELVLFDDLWHITGCSPDFTMEMFIFSSDIMLMAVRKFDPQFFYHIDANHVYKHPGGNPRNSWLYFQMLSEIEKDKENIYADIMASNLLRNMMLNIYDKFQRSNIASEPDYTRREEIYNQFMELVNRHGMHHRDVGFYAERLCITPRYLNEIISSLGGDSPKVIIDMVVLQEIKVLLAFSDMSIQQIADELKFPDQSYFGRYFKRLTGISPHNYRRKLLL